MYYHGGDIYETSRALGVGQDALIDLSASLNPLGMPGACRRLLRSIRPDALAPYPEPDARTLRDAVASRYGIDPARVVCGNGSTELIYLLPRALRPRRVLVPAPTFSEYERACVASGARVKLLKLSRKSAYSLDTDKYDNAMKGMDMAFLCNPNNPTGEVLTRAQIKHITDAARRARCVLVIDEAFIDFCPEHSVLTIDNPWVVVLRSLTKFYAMAGLRAGYAVASGAVLDALRSASAPWSVNTIASRIAALALHDRAFASRSIAHIDRERAYVESRLSALNIDWLPSSANYLLIHLPDPQATASRLLRDHHIMIRLATGFRNLHPSAARIAITTRPISNTLLNNIKA